MKIATISADRVTTVSLGLVGAVNILFFLAFVLTIAVTVPHARAQAPACNGINLIEAMKKDDPAGYAAMQKEADAIPNGDSVFYRIEKDGLAPSFLLGTMHVSDPRVLELPAPARKAYDGAGTVVIESTDVLDEQKAAAFMLQRLDLTMLPAGKQLSDYLSEDEMNILETGLKERGVSLMAMSRMRPWIISTLVALPSCEMDRRKDGAEMLDIKLAMEAKSAGKTVAGLETLAEQIEAMASLPIEFHAKGLVATVRLGDKLEDVFETMIRLYDSGDTGMIWPLLYAVDGQLNGGDGYSEFEETMVVARNHTMVTNAAPILQMGNAFIAVGALHLPGKEGVVALLREAGYTVTPEK